MWAADNAFEELISQLREAREINVGLASIELQFGPHAGLEPIRRRHRRVCDQILEIIGDLLCAERLKRVR